MPIYPLENRVQNYAWGSTAAITELLGQATPSPDPQAELWMGTHPQGPSVIVDAGHRMTLQQAIEQRPVDMLGRYAAGHFDNALPFLFKVLAAARPLSIQAHPSKAQAMQGFLKENRRHIALNAPERNYRDENHKPEIICALTPFWGLNGFRAPDSAARLLEPVCPDLLDDALAALIRLGEPGLRVFFASMMTLPVESTAVAAQEVRTRADKLTRESPVYRWIADLAAAYPQDMGILAPALLNLVCLQPGQAMYLPSGQLHAYLDGVGIELMANSDNVLRGGLTPKHVDVAELLDVVRFVQTPPAIIEGMPLRPGEAVYPCPAEEFVLSVVQVEKKRPYTAPSLRSVEILLCTSGEGRIEEVGREGEGLPINKGNSFLIPADLPRYRLRGELVAYKASVPLPHP